MASVKLTNVKKIYDSKVVAVQEFNLDIKDKEFVVFVGPSGCGKSTTLRMIAGLEEISEGTVEIDGEVVNDLQPKDRNIAMVFQNYALYPHLSVFENMAFSLRLKKVPNEIVYKKVTEAAEVLGITDLLLRKPRALSGGQRQRVAIGRAMVRDSKVFLMDEPLSNLDAKLRNQMRAEIILLRKKIDTTFIYVTHDQTEAMTLGDRIVIMKDGFIKQVGTPEEVFDRPANLFVAEFIGAPKMNTFKTQLVKDGDTHYVTPFGSKIEVTGEKGENLARNCTFTKEVILGVRPEHIVLKDEQVEDTIECVVQVNEMMGSELHLHVVTKDGSKLIVHVPTVNLSHQQRENLTAGAIIHVSFEGKVMHFFDVETEEFIGAPKMNTFKTQLVKDGDTYYVTPFGSKIEVTGEKGETHARNCTFTREVILGVRPEHIVLKDEQAEDTIECVVQVNEMMGSELHLHVVTKDGSKLIVRVPTVNLSHQQRENLTAGAIIHVSFEGKVMHFFDVETEESLLK